MRDADRGRAALEAIRRAVMDAGVAPGYHREVMARHRREWPALWRAIDAALAAVEADAAHPTNSAGEKSDATGGNRG